MNRYEPDEVSHPADTIEEITGIRYEVITPSVAEHLEKMTDVPARFWLNRWRIYNEHINTRRQQRQDK